MNAELVFSMRSSFYQENGELEFCLRSALLELALEVRSGLEVLSSFC